MDTLSDKQLFEKSQQENILYAHIELYNENLEGSIHFLEKFLKNNFENHKNNKVIEIMEISNLIKLAIDTIIQAKLKLDKAIDDRDENGNIKIE